MAPTRFPPSFDENPLSYGFALFSLTLIVAISLAILLGYLLERRTNLEVSARLGNMVAQPPRPFSLVDMHRLIVSGFLLTIVFGAFPDVLFLLAWGEAAGSTMNSLLWIDRIGDGLTVIPFLCSASLVLWAGQSVDHKLALDSIPVRLRPSLAHLKDRLKMIGIILFIAIGVTLAKSVA